MATEAVERCEAAARTANQKLAAGQAAMDQPYVHYQPYWVEGMGESGEAVLAAAEAGVPLRAAVWAHTAPPPEGAAPSEPAPPAAPAPASPPPHPASGRPGTASSQAQSQAAAPSSTGGATPAPQGPQGPPEVWTALRQASLAAGWESHAGRLVTLQVELPPSPAPPPPEPEDPKAKKAAAAKKDPKAKGKVSGTGFGPGQPGGVKLEEG